MYLNVCVCHEFFKLPEMAKMKFWTFQAFIIVVGYFIQYFICKCSFREISMVKKINKKNQSKPIFENKKIFLKYIYLKIKSKIQKFKICKLYIYYS